MITEIECRVCHRLDFNGYSECQECGWPIREIQLDEPVFGFNVAVEIRLGFCKTKVVEKHFATPSATTARNRAKRVHDFVRILAIRPLDEAHYISAYGDPRDKSKFA